MFTVLYLVALLSTTVVHSLASSFLSFVYDPNPRFFKNTLSSKDGYIFQQVNTSLGVAMGVQENGATRYAVKYASANRWQPSTVQKTWELPNGSIDPTVLPLPCPQPGVPSMSEDCLSMLLYVPDHISQGASTMIWIHGGSFYIGSATGPGLDGSNLAVATGSIIAVIQYRLGALGFMAPDGQTNLAVGDVINAMQFLQQILGSFGGNPNGITISGQSSGAGMVRALLATDLASPLYKSAIMQSDPTDYGFLSSGTQMTLQNYFNGLIPCSSSNTTCLSGLSLDQIINATLTLINQAPSLDPSTAAAEPIRPVHDGTLIKYTLDSTSPFPKVSKPLLLSTVKNEATLTIYGGFTSPVSASLYDQFVLGSLGSSRGSILLNSSYYSVPNDTADTRPQLEVMGTDYIWRCSTWTLAKEWVVNGGQAYVGLYTVGATYPGNEAVPECLTPGTVCHQDDIEIVFGTVPNPNSAQSTLTTQMQARYKAFMATGNPNTQGLSNWPAASSNNANAILLGTNSSMAPIGACTSSFWGVKVLYDYQIYNI